MTGTDSDVSNETDHNRPSKRAQNRVSEGGEASSTRNPRIIEEERQYPPRARGIYRRAMSGLSRKAAMDAFCIGCMGYNPHLVADCTAPQCALYPYRRGRPRSRATRPCPNKGRRTNPSQEATP